MEFNGCTLSKKVISRMNSFRSALTCIVQGCFIMLPVEAMSISEAASDDLLKVETPSTWDYGHSSNYVNTPALGCQPPRARNNFSIPATEDCEDSGKISKSISSTKIIPSDVFEYYLPLYSVIPSKEDGDSSLKDSGRGDFSFPQTD